MENTERRPAEPAFQVKSKDSAVLRRREEENDARLDRRWTPEGPGPVLSGGNIHYEISARTRAVDCGGLGLIQQAVEKAGLAESIDRRLNLLKRHLPYHESDHVLSLVYNVMSGGACLQDLQGRREDPVYLDSLGARKIPAPSTAGDFLRRFDREQIVELMEACNEARVKVWSGQGEDFLALARLDVDGTAAPTLGELKEGIDVNYKGEWGYAPLVISLANTNEVLCAVNRPGNRPSHDGAVEWIDRCVSVARRGGFRKVRLRGDTDFALTGEFDRWSEDGVEFVFAKDAPEGLVKRAEQVPADQWKPLRRGGKRGRGAKAKRKRRRRANAKKRVIQRRGFRDLKLEREEVAEIDYRPRRCRRDYRLVMVRKTIQVTRGQKRLYDEVRYLLYITNVDKSELTAAQAVRENNGRGNQENVIEQLKNGVSALRMPSDTLLSNWAYLVIAAQAWNLKAWLALLLVRKREAAQLLRMEFRRFLNCVIRLPCQIVRTGRRLVFRLLNVNEWTSLLLEGSRSLKQLRL